VRPCSLLHRLADGVKRQRCLDDSITDQRNRHQSGANGAVPYCTAQRTGREFVCDRT
jgi:hypothetical protein